MIPSFPSSALASSVGDSSLPSILQLIKLFLGLLLWQTCQILFLLHLSIGHTSWPKTGLSVNCKELAPKTTELTIWFINEAGVTSPKNKVFKQQIAENGYSMSSDDFVLFCRHLFMQFINPTPLIVDLLFCFYPLLPCALKWCNVSNVCRKGPWSKTIESIVPSLPSSYPFSFLSLSPFLLHSLRWRI